MSPGCKQGLVVACIDPQTKPSPKRGSRSSALCNPRWQASAQKGRTTQSPSKGEGRPKAQQHPCRGGWERCTPVRKPGPQGEDEDSSYKVNILMTIVLSLGLAVVLAQSK